MDGNKINLLKSYFTDFQLNNEFYSYADLARYLGVSTAIVIDEHNFIEDGKLKIPSSNHFIQYFAKMRITGPELKYTLVLDWNNLREVLCERTQNFLIKSDCILMAMSNLYYTICTDEFNDIKRLIVVFASDEEEDYQLFRRMCNDSKYRVLPLLYDENAEYSIRDVDMLNGIG